MIKLAAHATEPLEQGELLPVALGQSAKLSEVTAEGVRLRMC